MGRRSTYNVCCLHTIAICRSNFHLLNCQPSNICTVWGKICFRDAHFDKVISYSLYGKHLKSNIFIFFWITHFSKNRSGNYVFHCRELPYYGICLSFKYSPPHRKTRKRQLLASGTAVECENPWSHPKDVRTARLIDPLLPGDFVTEVKQINSQSDLIWITSFAGLSYLTIRSSVNIILISDPLISILTISAKQDHLHTSGTSAICTPFQ